ncbi:MAG TPA: histidine phosphatase family protein [Bryobacteraceae bacterium]|jgi:phosphohistidine phosphatase SixA|nr:histidine phosphatase family protein [Bryobacteraceae bacterium]
MRPLAATCALLYASVSLAQSVAPAPSIVNTLRHGGCVIVMRHASSPREVPAGATERQLDDTGRSSATAMGKAFRDLKIPVGEVFTSPTARARETIRLAQWPNPRPVPELGDNGRSMQGGTAAQADWLKKRATEFPNGTNTILVTHFPNLTGAFPQQAAGMEDGEALIFIPDGRGGAKVLGRVKIDDWLKMK